jgi:nitrite reductase/ring-hydroxylating ferredoxin subunit
MRAICKSEEIVNGGPAVRFSARVQGVMAPAFVVRYQDEPRAFVNECAHIPVELDFKPGQIFDQSGEYLVCSMHGAYYAPDSGECVGGPCRGALLVPLAIRESDGQIWLIEDEK